MHLLSLCAEAKVWKDGERIIKERVEKKYRIKELDEKIRKTRTRREANLLIEARRFGIPVPRVLEVRDFEIVMEYIEGEKLRDFLFTCSQQEVKEFFCDLGRLVAKLHACGIIHGDLTTSNILVKEGKLWFIDFGLGFFSKRYEDMATDLAVLKESLLATHSSIAKVCWTEFLNSYEKNFEEAKKVLNQLEKIEKRGRYVRKD